MQILIFGPWKWCRLLKPQPTFCYCSFFPPSHLLIDYLQLDNVIPFCFHLWSESDKNNDIEGHSQLNHPNIHWEPSSFTVITCKHVHMYTVAVKCYNQHKAQILGVYKFEGKKKKRLNAITVRRMTSVASVKPSFNCMEPQSLE